MRAISMPRTRRTVIEATTSSRASFSFTLLRRISDMRESPLLLAGVMEQNYAATGKPQETSIFRAVEQGSGRTMNYATDFKSVQHDVSPEEWQTRVDLAACYRLVDKYGMTDLIYNHITARIPGTEDHLLINLYGMLYKEITASSLVKIDVEGNILWKPDTDYGINKSGYVIHGAIHTARPDVACVLH